MIEDRIEQPMKPPHPYAYRLQNVEWFLFGTLTWENWGRQKNTYAAESKRTKDFNDLVAVFCGIMKLRRRQLAFYKATEFGKSGQAHFHFVIGKSGCEHLSADECAKVLTELWEKRLERFDSNFPGVGKAKIVPYDKAEERPAVDYCLKREFDENGNEYERHDYLSPKLIKLIQFQINNPPVSKQPKDTTDDIFQLAF